MLYAIKQFSGNKKTGPITVTRSPSSTCPKSCGQFYNCYGKGGNSRIHWNALDREDQRPSHVTWKELLKAIKFTATELWRFNETGGLPGKGNVINAKKLDELAEANKGRKGFTYSHKPLFSGVFEVFGKPGVSHKSRVSAKTAEANRTAIKAANDKGFVINLSADTLQEADAKKALNIGPVVVVLPKDAETGVKYETPKGEKVVTCPAAIKENVGRIFCANCGLCAVKERKSIIGFPAHGFAAKRTSYAALKIVA